MACDLRLQGLEKKILIEAGETPAVVYEMKKQVDSFREKLEVQTKYSGALKLLFKFGEKKMELINMIIQWHNHLHMEHFNPPEKNITNLRQQSEKGVCFI